MSKNVRQRVYFYGSLVAIFLSLAGAIKNPVLSAQAPTFGLAQADPARLKNDVETLASANPPRSYEHIESLERAADFISGAFTKDGLATHSQEFKVFGQKFRNVIAHLGPKDGELLVIGAHYDVAGDQSGADDNASGIAGLLEVARLLAPVQNKLKRPIELVAYSLEEPPNFGEVTMGSYFHANALREQKVQVKLMISLEMIGYFSDESWSQKYPMPLFYLLYPTTGNYISLLARPSEWGVMRDVKGLFMGGTSIPLKTANVPEFVPGLSLSDHFNYWEAGFPAMMITDTAFMRNHNYHQKQDTPEKLNYARMADVVNGVTAVALGL